MHPVARTQLCVSHVAGRSVVTGARSATPLRLLTPKNHGHGAWVFQSSYGGGFVGDDDLGLDVTVAPAATLFLSSQASSKVYRATRSRYRLSATVAEGATLVLWPDPVVCFSGASLEQTQRFELAATGNLLCVDAWTAGRTAFGERWAFHHLSAKLAVDVDGTPRFRDNVVLSNAHGALCERMGSIDVMATVVLAGPSLSAAADVLHRAVTATRLERVGRGALVVSSRWPWGLALRIAARTTEAYGRTVRNLLRPLVHDLLGDDPCSRKW